VFSSLFLATKKAFVSCKRDESLNFRGTTLIGIKMPAFGIGPACRANTASLVTVRKSVPA
jgi:hypothetical protein